MYALRISFHRGFLLWCFLGALVGLGGVQKVAAQNAHYFNGSGSSMTVRWSKLPSGSSTYQHFGPYTVAHGAFQDLTIAVASGDAIWMTVHYPGIVDAPPCGDTIPRAAFPTSTGVATGGGCGTTWVAGGSSVQMYWQSGSSATNYYNNGAVTNLTAISGDYLLLVYTNGANLMYSNWYRLDPNDSFTWNITNTTPITVEVVKPGGPENDYRPIASVQGTVGTNVTTGPTPATTANKTSGDPYANIPLRSNITTNQAQADRQNSEAIIKAIGAGDAAIINLLGQMVTNQQNSAQSTNGVQRVAGANDIDTNPANYATNGQAYHGSFTNGIWGAVTNIGTVTNGIGSYPVNSDYYKVAMPGNFLPGALKPTPFENNKVDLMDNPQMNDAIPWARSIIIWCSAFSLLVLVIRDVVETLSKIGTFQQGRSANVGVTVLGNGVQTTLATHIPTIAVISVAVVAFIAVVWASYAGMKSGSLAIVWLDPFTSSNPIMQQATHLILKFFPLEALVAQWVSYFTFRLLVSAAVLVLQGVIRWTPGMILLGFVSLDAQAQNVSVDNFTGSNVVMQAGVFETVLQPGAGMAFDSAGPLTFKDAGGGLIGDYSVPPSGFVFLHVCLSNGVPAVVVAMERPSLWDSVKLGSKFGGVLVAGMGVFWLARFLMTPASPERVG